MWPSMVTHTRNLCSAFNPSKCTHTQQWVVNKHTHTHREHTPRAVGSQCCSTRGAVGDSVPCSRVSPQLWYWGWREHWTFTPPTYNPARPETRTLNLWVTSLTLYPLGHDRKTLGLEQHKKMNNMWAIISGYKADFASSSSSRIFWAMKGEMWSHSIY